MSCRSRMRASNASSRFSRGDRVARHAGLARARGDLERELPASVLLVAGARRRARRARARAHARVEVDRVELARAAPRRGLGLERAHVGRGAPPALQAARERRGHARRPSALAEGQRRDRASPAVCESGTSARDGRGRGAGAHDRASFQQWRRRAEHVMVEVVRAGGAREQPRQGLLPARSASRSSTSSTTTSSASRPSCAACASARR